MLKLFCVKNQNGRPNKQAGFFCNKMSAKVVRDTLENHTVGLGPDHIGKHGQRTKFMTYKRN